jgi:hypothetical protein
MGSGLGHANEGKTEDKIEQKPEMPLCSRACTRGNCGDGGGDCIGAGLTKANPKTRRGLSWPKDKWENITGG